MTRSPASLPCQGRSPGLFAERGRRPSAKWAATASPGFTQTTIAWCVAVRDRRDFVPAPLSVFCARMPSAFTSFYDTVGKLDKKLALDAQTVSLLRERVAGVNNCAYCMASNRWQRFGLTRDHRQAR